MVGQPKGAPSIPECVESDELPSVVVLKPDDVILSKVGASLNLDKDKVAFPDILYPVGDARRYIDCFALGEDDIRTVKRDSRTATNSHPMLRTMSVFLIAEALPRQHFDPLDLVRRCFVENGKGSPRPAIELR
jgi:hypothetical protein